MTFIRDVYRRMRFKVSSIVFMLLVVVDILFPIRLSSKSFKQDSISPTSLRMYVDLLSHVTSAKDLKNISRWHEMPQSGILEIGFLMYRGLTL